MKDDKSREPGTVKKVPLSIEDILARKKAAEEAEKPKFYTKAERQAMALEKNEAEAKALREKREEELARLRELHKPHEDSRDQRRGRERDSDRNKERTRDSGRGRDRYDDRERYRARDDGRDKERNRESSSSNKPKGDIKDLNLKGEIDETISSKEKQVIRERFMGLNNKKQKIKRVKERKFVFDWDATEDTSTDYNPLYTNKHQAQMFGRGHFAGFDTKEPPRSLAAGSRFYDTLLKDRRTAEEIQRANELAKLHRSKENRVLWDDRHWKDKPLEDMKDRDWRIFREDFNITTKGGNIPKPIRSWEEAPIPEEIKQVIKEIGYSEPTPIQRQAIPIGLQHRDIIGIAETGSGKTASFVIPMLSFINKMPKMRNNPERQALGPYAIILAPTRELALQIESETQKFALPMKYKCISIIGGRNINDQAISLREGAEIIISTPGRLRDCLDRRILVLSQCTYVVMDEADRMVDMGFEEDVNYILDNLPVSNLRPESDELGQSVDKDAVLGHYYRQTTMFSATMPAAVERLAKRYLRQPANVTIGNAGQAVDTVRQIVEMISDENRKKARMLDLVRKYDKPIIIFVNTKVNCDKVATDLAVAGFNSVILHGGKNQDQRESALNQLKNGSADILVATDVAGRGIDIKDVTLVLNYDMAKSIEDYTHRIGRTGRAGKSGDAVTFLGDNTEIYYDLKQMLMKAGASIPAGLANHEDAIVKPGTFPANRKRGDEIIFS